VPSLFRNGPPTLYKTGHSGSGAAAGDKQPSARHDGTEVQGQWHAWLVRDGGLAMRYDTEEGVDGLPPGEGAFLACSFWLADNYILQHRYDDARVLFEHLLALRNDLGLLAEEYDPRTGRMVGNFPQAFSHVGLINTAIKLARVEESGRTFMARGGSGRTSRA
jgi:Glycosyl hydrolases family 15